MKATGMVRNIDQLGRVVIPMELRRTLDIKDADPIEIYMGEDNEIILKPFSIHCTFCDEAKQDKLKKYKSKLICTKCISQLKQTDEKA